MNSLFPLFQYTKFFFFFLLFQTSFIKYFLWGTLFQERFTEDWLKISAIGIQSGSIPEVLIQITGNNISWTSRTFLATILAYDINSVMNAGGLANVYFVTQRKLKNYGYGTEKVKVYPN